MDTLEDFRTHQGLTQADIASMTGLTRQSVSAIECHLWEHFPKDVHLKLKPIARDEFGYPWPDTYEYLESRYQTHRVDRRVYTRQTTQIATTPLHGPHRILLVRDAHLTGQHVFATWRQRAVGQTSLRTFAKLLAINPELVRDYERSKPFSTMPSALEEALLDCSVNTNQLKLLVSEYWADQR